MSIEAPQSARQPNETEPPRVTLMDSPLLLGGKVQEEADRKRAELPPQIVEYIKSSERFAGLDVKVSFAKKGVSSLVSIIETPQEKVVLKIPLSARQGESEFLKAWEGEGVAVPHVIDEGFIGDHPFTLMNYIDAPTLNEHHSYSELVQQETYIDMGRTLRTMHRPATQGYGAFVDGRGEFETFKNWVESAFVTKRTRYVEENQILDDTHGSLSEAKDILIAHVGSETRSSYCHGDFDVCNIFDTKPLTIFDPGPNLNNGYLDLALAMVIAKKQVDDDMAAEQLKGGYFEGETYDAKALQASILLSSYFKLAYWHKAEKTKQIDRIRKYLQKTRHLLTA